MKKIWTIIIISNILVILSAILLDSISNSTNYRFCAFIYVIIHLSSIIFTTICVFQHTEPGEEDSSIIINNIIYISSTIITILILTYLLPLKNKELVYISEPTIQIQCENKLFSNSETIDVIAGGEKINFTVEIINQNEFDFDLEYKVKQSSAIRGGKAIELTEVSSTKKSKTFEISPKSIGEAQIIFELKHFGIPPIKEILFVMVNDKNSVLAPLIIQRNSKKIKEKGRRIK